MSPGNNTAAWSKAEDEVDENALVMFAAEEPNPWPRISDCLPGNSPYDVAANHEALLHGVGRTESAAEVPNPWQGISDCLPGNSPYHVAANHEALLHGVGRTESAAEESNPWQGISGCSPANSPYDVAANHEASFNGAYQDSSESVIGLGRRRGRKKGKGTKSRAKSGRKKGKPWTKEEHIQFLHGLLKYGPGDWRSISRNCVQTRTPSQIASHAQKYFQRLELPEKDRKRSSIHDITSAHISVNDYPSAAHYSAIQEIPAMCSANCSNSEQRNTILSNRHRIPVPAECSVVQQWLQMPNTSSSCHDTPATAGCSSIPTQLQSTSTATIPTQWPQASSTSIIPATSCPYLNIPAASYPYFYETHI